MKKIILLCLLTVFFVSCFGQIDTLKQPSYINATGYIYKQLGADSAIYFPTDTFHYKYSRRAIAFKGENPYFWNGRYYQAFGVGSEGSTKGLDSVLLHNPDLFNDHTTDFNGNLWEWLNANIRLRDENNDTRLTVNDDISELLGPVANGTGYAASDSNRMYGVPMMSDTANKMLLIINPISTSKAIEYASPWSLPAWKANSLNNKNYEQFWNWTGLGADTSLNLLGTGSSTTSGAQVFTRIELTGTGSGNSKALYVANTKGSAGLSGTKYGIYATTNGTSGTGNAIAGYFEGTGTTSVGVLQANNLGTGAGNTAFLSNSVGGGNAEFINTYTGSSTNTNVLIQSTGTSSSAKKGLTISVAGGTTNEAIDVDAGLSNFRYSSTATAYVHIGATSGTTGALKIEPASLLGTPQPYLFEPTTTHLYWTDAGGNRFQLDNDAGGGGTNIYNEDGTLDSIRTLNGDGFPLILDSMGGFYVKYYNSGADSGRLAIVQGFDFIGYDDDYSTSIIANTLQGIKLNITDLATSDETGIELDPSRKILFKDASLDAASNGYVWTLIDDATGEGGWAAPAGGSGLFPTTGTGTASGNVTGDLDGNDLTIDNVLGMSVNFNSNIVFTGNNNDDGTSRLSFSNDGTDNEYELFSRGASSSDQKIGLYGFHSSHTMYSLLDGDSVYMEMDASVPELTFDAGTNGEYWFHDMLTTGGDTATWKPVTIDANGKIRKGVWAYAGGGGSSAFNDITTGTNTTATMTVGAGGTLTYTSTGIVNASRFQGVTSVDATEFGYLNNATSEIQGQLDNKQPADAELTQIAGLSPSTNDFLQYTGGSWNLKSISDVRTALSINNVENTALSTWPGTSNITTLGTIGTGVWNGTAIAGQYGGTGVANTGKTITVSGNTVIGSSTHTVTLNTSGNTSVTLPTSGNILSDANTISVGQGGTGVASVTANSYLKGNGTSPLVPRTYSEVKTDLSLENVTNESKATMFTNATFTGTFNVADGAIANADLANSTISGISLGSNLANLTATDATVTFSGTYNGSTARTIGLNLGNANTWTADQSVPDEVYDATNWNGSVEVPTKNAIRDKIESLSVGGVSDGDKGDITVSSSGATWTIDNNVVTFAKMQAITDNRLLGAQGGTAVEEISLTANDFDLGSNTLSIDYTNGQAASGSTKGFLTSADWTTFNDKPTASSTTTFTNKRITPRTGSTTSSATPTINTDNVDVYELTAQAADITSFTTNLSGTPTADQTLHIIITGTATRAITWGSSFEASTIALPTTTVGTNRLDVWFTWNATTSKWRCSGVY